MPFEPRAGESLTIGGVRYEIVGDPSAPGAPFRRPGQQTMVYLLRSAEGRHALKVFEPRFRAPRLVGLTERFAALADVPGLQVCRRTVLTPRTHPDLLRQYPDLTYAVLMPWIEGPTWGEVLTAKDVALTPQQGLHLARALAEILTILEERGLAHCDLSAANVMVPGLQRSGACYADTDAVTPVALVDVEQLYAPGLDRPATLPPGSPGYLPHAATEIPWGPEADRFAGAVLLAEMLGASESDVRDGAWGDSYFDPAEIQAESERYKCLRMALRQRWGKSVSALLKHAWRGDAFTFGEWSVTLPESAPARGAGVPCALDLEGNESVISALIDLGRQLEWEGNLTGALTALRQAQAYSTPENSRTPELTRRLRALEAHLAETLPTAPAAVVAPSVPPTTPAAVETNPWPVMAPEPTIDVPPGLGDRTGEAPGLGDRTGEAPGLGDRTGEAPGLGDRTGEATAPAIPLPAAAAPVYPMPIPLAPPAAPPPSPVAPPAAPPPSPVAPPVAPVATTPAVPPVTPPTAAHVAPVTQAPVTPETPSAPPVAPVRPPAPVAPMPRPTPRPVPEEPPRRGSPACCLITILLGILVGGALFFGVVLPNRAALAPLLPFLPQVGGRATPAQQQGPVGPGRGTVAPSGEVTGTVTGETPSGRPSFSGTRPPFSGTRPPFSGTRGPRGPQGAAGQPGGAPPEGAPAAPGGAAPEAPISPPADTTPSAAGPAIEVTSTVAAAAPTTPLMMGGSGARTPLPPPPAETTGTPAAAAAAPVPARTRVGATGPVTRTRGTPTPTVEPTATPLPTATSTPSPTPTPALSTGMTITRPVDGMLMVAVPGGAFEMGTSAEDLPAITEACKAGGLTCKPDWFANEQPTHTVTLNPFWIDRTEVTNAQFIAFLNARGANADDGTPYVGLSAPDSQIQGTEGSYRARAGSELYPAIRVYRAGAEAYCQWVEARLATEAEWEYAARGSEHRIFPWGDQFDGTVVNYWATSDGYTQTARVGSYPEGASWAGALDMVGNASEWVNDWFAPYSAAPERDPQGPAVGELRVVRGGSCYNSPVDVRTTARGVINAGDTNRGIGFRCAKPAG